MREGCHTSRSTLSAHEFGWDKSRRCVGLLTRPATVADRYLYLLQDGKALEKWANELKMVQDAARTDVRVTRREEIGRASCRERVS